MNELKLEVELTKRAYILYESGRYQMALDTLAEIDSAPAIYVYHSYCSTYVNSCIKLNDIDKAKDFVHSELMKNPDESMLFYFMSEIYSQQNRIREGLKFIQKALEIDPEVGQYHIKTASLYLQEEDITKANHHLTIAEEICPEDEMGIYMRTVISILIQDSKKASEALKRGLELYPDSSVFHNLYIFMDKTNRPDMETFQEMSLIALENDPFDHHAQQNLLFSVKNKNPLVRFFVSKGFNRYHINWTPRTIIVTILCWKGVILWGGFGLLYLMVTWAGTAMFYTVIRQHPMYKYVLPAKGKAMSNVFVSIIAIAMIILPIILLQGYDGLTIFGFISGFFFLLLTSISFFEITKKIGKQTFTGYMLVSGFVLFQVSNDMLVFGIVSILLLLIYAFFFTLNIAFK